MGEELDLFEFVAMTASTSVPEGFTEPDDDWTPVMFMESADGGSTVMPLFPYMGTEKDKDILAGILMPGAIKHVKAVRVVLVLSVWAAHVASPEELEPIRYVPPSQRANREEKVLIVEYTAEGVMRTASAAIERHEDAPPTLADWDEDMDGAKIGGEGRFVEPIVEALRQVSLGT